MMTHCHAAVLSQIACLFVLKVIWMSVLFMKTFMVILLTWWLIRSLNVKKLQQVLNLIWWMISLKQRKNQFLFPLHIRLCKQMRVIISVCLEGMWMRIMQQQVHAVKKLRMPSKHSTLRKEVPKKCRATIFKWSHSRITNQQHLKSIPCFLKKQSTHSKNKGSCGFKKEWGTFTGNPQCKGETHWELTLIQKTKKIKC